MCCDNKIAHCKWGDGIWNKQFDVYPRNTP